MHIYIYTYDSIYIHIERGTPSSIHLQASNPKDWFEIPHSTGFPVDFSMAVATWYWDGRSDVGMGLLLGLGVKEDSTQHTLTKTNMFAVENSC